MTQDQSIENVVIIGGGPAGLSAALYNARAGLQPLVFAGSPPGGQLTLTTEVENFPGHMSVLGPELIMKMREQVKHFNTRIKDENVASVHFDAHPFEIVSAASGEVTRAKTVIIATGAKALWLDLENEQRLRGKGISACATCDGFFFRGKTVAIIGGGDTAMEEAMTLTHFAQKVYVIHRRNEFRASKIMQERVKTHEKIEIIWNTAVVDVLGDEKVTGAKLKNVENGTETEVSLDGIFVAIGHKPDTELFTGKILLDEKGYIYNGQYYALHHLTVPGKDAAQFDSSFPTMTSVPGVFAGGDCVDTIYRQASTAAGMGVAAALDAERWLQINQS